MNRIFEGERYYNEKGEMGILISFGKDSFASYFLDIATDKRVIDYFLANGMNLVDYEISYKYEAFLNSLGYEYYFNDMYRMHFDLEFIPVGKKFRVIDNIIRDDYGEFSGYQDKLEIFDDNDWITAE